MTDISSEAKKAGLQETDKPVEEMTEEELKAFRMSFDPDMMGFDGEEGIDEEAADVDAETDKEGEGDANGN